MTAVGWRPEFAYGLALWVLATATLVWTEDSILLPSVVLLGSFEEFFKAAGVFVLSGGLVHWSIRDGILLGTTGFGAFEASGYTLTLGHQRGRVLPARHDLRGGAAHGH